MQALRPARAGHHDEPCSGLLWRERHTIDGNGFGDLRGRIGMRERISMITEREAC